MLAEASESTRREYAARMNRVVDHIQGHPADPLNLERLAAVACFSPYHFHRLFGAWMGETLQDFVHRLRLERAAQLLVFNQVRSISEIALECGFSSASAFARAFKEAFGVAASEWRKRKICQSNRKPWEAGEDASLGFSKLPGPKVRNKEIPMTSVRLDVKVRHLAPATIAYIRHIGPYKGDTALFRRLFGQLFAWPDPAGSWGPIRAISPCVRIIRTLHPQRSSGWKWPSPSPPAPLHAARLASKRWTAAARVRVRIEDYAAQWDALVADWLPGSGYQPDHRPAMEFYLNNPDTDPEGLYDVEICLPVQPL